MKLALVHSFYTRAVASGENLVVEAQAASLRAAGHEVVVVGRETDELAQDRWYKVKTSARVASGYGGSPRRDLEALNPDAIIVHNLFPNFGTRWLEGWRSPVVAVMHNYRPLCSAATLFRDGHFCTDCLDNTSLEALRNRCYRDSAVATLPLAIRNARGPASDPLLRRANRIVVLSQRSLKIYSSALGETSRFRVIPNFVTPTAASTVRPIDWFYAGRLTPEKGIRELTANWPNSEHLTIAGDGPLAPEIKAWCANTGNTFLGQVPNAHVRGALAVSKGLVIPSLWPEGLPTVFLEACAAGVPIVAFHANAAADEVRLHSAGTVFDEWNQLDAALHLTSQDRGKLAVNARRLFEERYTEAAWRVSMNDLLKDVS